MTSPLLMTTLHGGSFPMDAPVERSTRSESIGFTIGHNDGRWISAPPSENLRLWVVVGNPLFRFIWEELRFSASLFRFLQRCSGGWIDSLLTRGRLICFVTQKVMDRLRAIRSRLCTMLGLHPIIVQQMVDAVIIPTLFYALPVWCSVICHASCLVPLDRLLRQCSICVRVFSELLHWTLHLCFTLFCTPKYKFGDE